MRAIDRPCQVCGEPLDQKVHLSIVVPIYKSESHIPNLLGFIEELNAAFPGGVAATFVIDGSPENERAILESKMANLSFASQVVQLSRNFGVGPALHAALGQSSGCATVVFGSDLQEPSELFLIFGEKIICEGRDVLLGQRLTRDDPLTMRVFSSFYWWVNRRFLENDTPKGGFDVFGISKRARDALVALPELNTNISSQLQWIGFTREYVPFHRRARQSGKSTWTFRRKLKLFADSIFGFTGAPITIILVIGLSLTLTFGVLGILTLAGSIMGKITLPGYTTLVFLSAIGHSLTITVCGIIGGYVHRTFENSKGRPKFIVSEIIRSSNFPDHD